MKLSPSQIVTFDSSTPFGCRRKWWLKHVAKLPGVQNTGQVAGEQAHAVLEDLLASRRGSWNDWQMRVAHAAGGYVADIRSDVLSVEQWMYLQLGEHSMKGRIDVILKDGVLDWKTTKKLEYAKTPLALKSDTQMLSYAKYLFEDELKHLDEMFVKHVYITTSMPTTVREVSTRVTRAHVDNEFRVRIMPLVDEMESTSKETDVSRVKPDLTKCRFCEYKDKCPQGATETMSIFEKILSAPSVATPAGVFPPDAPVEALTQEAQKDGEYKVTAADVAAFAAPAPAAEAKPEVKEALEDLVGGVPAPRRGRKSKAAKAEIVVYEPKRTPPARPSVMPEQPAPAPVMHSFNEKPTERRVRLSVGLTLNTGNFESVRLDAEVSENVNDESLESARERLNQSIKTALLAQAGEWVEQMKKLTGKK